MSALKLLKHPSAFLPVMMSATALSIVVGYLALHGLAKQADEGAAAHSFQLLLLAQVPIVLFFAAKWVPRSPKEAYTVLAIQFVAGVAALAPIFILEW
jgi:hypothetical protein